MCRSRWKGRFGHEGANRVGGNPGDGDRDGGCGDRGAGTPTTPAPMNGAYSVQLETRTPSGLPPCNGRTRGETAMVTATLTLESCIGGFWVPIPCTSLIGGAVAYNSTTDTLWACFAKPRRRLAAVDADRHRGTARASGGRGAAGSARTCGTAGTPGRCWCSGTCRAHGRTGTGRRSWVRVTRHRDSRATGAKLRRGWHSSRCRHRRERRRHS
jgi:hypothetical protein